MEEWGTITSLTDDRSIVIKKADNGSCIVVWDRNDCFEGKELSNPSVYRDVSNNKKILPKLSETSSKMFSSLRRKVF